MFWGWPLGAGVGKLWPTGQVWPAICFYKVLLEHGQVYFMCYCLWLLSHKGRVKQLWQTLYELQSQKYLLFDLLQKTSCWPHFKIINEAYGFNFKCVNGNHYRIVIVQWNITTFIKVPQHYENLRSVTFEIKFIIYTQITYILGKFISESTWKGKKNIKFINAA